LRFATVAVIWLRLAPFIQQDSAHAGHTGAGWQPVAMALWATQGDENPRAAGVNLHGI
jgi:hypothetical protein